MSLKGRVEYASFLRSYSSITSKSSCNIRNDATFKNRTPIHHFRRRHRPPKKHLLPNYHFTTFLIIIITTITSNTLSVSAQDSNHYFCGTSWGDASDNCQERQHCQGGNDDECETTGHICFGGTTCDSREGHGNKFKYANVAYGDISNTRFCGKDWAAAIDDCSMGTHCPSGFSEECPESYSCYGGLQCNVQDLLEALEEAAESEVPEANRISKHDPKRHNFCGTSWGDANGDCSMWCPGGDDTDCPEFLGCFGNTGCYYDADLVPTSTPVTPPSLAPSTLPPIAYLDPANVRYCGITWALATAECSVETHCPSGLEDDCPKGQTCHGGISTCNIIDLMLNENRVYVPTGIPTMAPITSDDPSNSKFCGKSWNLAKENCSLETHCPSDTCPNESICYGGIGCNASEMTTGPTGKPSKAPTNSPTNKPTAPTMSPSVSPTTETRAPVTVPPTISFPPTAAPIIPADDIRHSYYCGKDWADVSSKCHAPCVTGSDTDCPDGMTCIAFTPCRPAPKETPKPTRKPATRKPRLPPSPPPTPVPTDTVVRTTNNPVTEAPSSKLIESTMKPSKKPTKAFFSRSPMRETTITMRPTTMKPATSPPTEKPTEVTTVEIIQTEFELDVVSTPAPWTPPPSGKPSPKPTRNPTKKPTNPPQTALPPSTTASIPAPSQELMAKVGSILVAAASGISNDVLLSIDTTTGKESPTQVYQYGGFINALGVVSKGDMGSTYFYLGSNDNVGGFNYGLANVAIFLAQAAVETIQFDICDEISWEKDVFGKYPLSNSCGQGRSVGVSMVSYEDSNPCADHEAFMACPVDPETIAVAETHGIFVGAPPPLECFPRTTTDRFTGGWDPSLSCLEDGCNSYDGQMVGNIDPLSIPTVNSFGRNNVEGCCWWGRGPFPRGSAGTCIIGKLNHHLGKRAFDEGRSSARYKEIDFCKDPSAICRGFYQDNEANAEIRWLMGMLYWINKVQTYNVDGWSYLERLKQFTDGGMNDVAFLENVSRIVTRGCHDQSRCGNAVSSNERRAKFDKIIYHFGKAHIGTSKEGQTSLPTRNPTRFPSTRPTLVPTPKPTNPPVALMDPTRPPTTHPTDHSTLLSAASFPVSPSPVAISPEKVVTSPPVSVVPEDDYKLTSGELANRLNYANNYCASSSEEVNAKCASSLRTCNFGDPPCKQRTACYENVICSIIWSNIEFESPNESAPEIETAEESPPKSDSVSSAVSCNQICLRPLSANECIAGGDAIASLPDCVSVVAVGQMCENKDECGGGAHANISQCPGGRGIFMRILSEQCGTSTTDSPSTDGSHHSFPPSINAPPSSKPSLSDDYDLNGTHMDHNNSNPVGDSVGEYEEFSGLKRKDDDSGPGAWWTWYDTSRSTRLYAMPMFSLFCCAVALVFTES